MAIKFRLDSLGKPISTRELKEGNTKERHINLDTLNQAGGLFIPTWNYRRVVSIYNVEFEFST
jgi:hypothetical protein